MEKVLKFKNRKTEGGLLYSRTGGEKVVYVIVFFLFVIRKHPLPGKQTIYR